jgi:hypothetical protein
VNAMEQPCSQKSKLSKSEKKGERCNTSSPRKRIQGSQGDDPLHRSTKNMEAPALTNAN